MTGYRPMQELSSELRHILTLYKNVNKTHSWLSSLVTNIAQGNEEEYTVHSYTYSKGHKSRVKLRSAGTQWVVRAGTQRWTHGEAGEAQGAAEAVMSSDTHSERDRDTMTLLDLAHFKSMSLPRWSVLAPPTCPEATNKQALCRDQLKINC